jgi:hypothetical protein
MWREAGLLRVLLLTFTLTFFSVSAPALEKPDVTYQIFQFPADKAPVIDGDASDWDLVPESYVVDRSHMHNTASPPPAAGDQTLACRVKVGWVKGENRLYFLYEAEDDYWDFASPGLRNDTFEIMVDGDASGGPFVARDQKSVWTPELISAPELRGDSRISDEAHRRAVHGVHAQNYHVFTPAVNKDWAFVLGAATWIKDAPWAKSAHRYSFKHGESGRLTLEFYITPFDYAGAEGPERSVTSILTENKIIGLSWIVIDYDGPTPRGFWCLSPQRSAFGHASLLCAFRLMPLEAAVSPPQP